jgi:hypothetical protein
MSILSSFSGYTALPAYSSVIWNSNYLARSFWLLFLIECPAWKWTYLGFYTDAYYDDASRTVVSAEGTAVWMFTSEKDDLIPEDEQVFYFRYAQVFLPWRAVVVRLAYISLFDNLVYVVWMRYAVENAPYTSYINNSEILTLLLFILLALYTYARMRTHVIFVAGEKDKPISIHSTTRDLCKLNKPNMEFRTTTGLRWVVIAYRCVAATLAEAMIGYLAGIVMTVVLIIMGCALLDLLMGEETRRAEEWIEGKKEWIEGKKEWIEGKKEWIEGKKEEYWEKHEVGGEEMERSDW